MNSDENKKENLLGVIRRVADKLKKDKKTLLILLLGLCGMLLILFSDTDDAAVTAVSDKNNGTYAEDIILKQVRELISDINGVGKTEVVITYENDFENIYATNTNEQYNGDDIDIDREYIVTDDETGLVIKTVYPKVRGVAVVCQGGSDPAVKEKIYSVLSALFDISSSKISVTDMK